MLTLSTKRPLDVVRRWLSRFVWARWLLGFLFWELLGDLSWTPWKTLSETAWDVEQEYPGAQRELEAFLLGLVVHIRYRYTLESSVEWGRALETQFDAFVTRTAST